MNASNPFASNILDTSAGGLGEQMLNQCLGFIRRNGYNGFDVDWEYPPNNNASRQAMVVWLRKARAIMNTWPTHGYIFLTIPQWSEWQQGNPNAGFIYDSQAWQYVDYVQIMAYNDNANAICSHNSPIYAYPKMPSGYWYWDFRGWHENIIAGVPMNKQIYLASAEVHQYTGTNLSLGSAGSNTGSGYWSINHWPTADQQSPQWDTAAQCTYFCNGSLFLTYETYRSMMDKAQYVKSQVYNGVHLGGMGVYDPWRLYDARMTIPDSAMRGFVAGMGDTGVSPPPPPPVYKLKGQLFFDKNSNGVQDAGEPGLAGWTVHLTGTVTDSQITNSSGQYLFDSLPTGSYQISQNVRPQWRQTFPANNGTYAESIPASMSDGNFGDFAIGAIPIPIFQYWNMLSLPAIVTDNSISTLFPTAASEAFSYQEGAYIPTENLFPGPGYWIRFGMNQTEYIIGQPIDADTVTMATADWTIIGSVGHPVAVSSVQTNPSGIIDSRFFSYQNGFIVSDTIQPGLGYWVKLSAPGSIVLSSSSAQQSIAPKETADLSGMNSITFLTAKGYTQTLYFGENTSTTGLESIYKLPPLFPGVFTVQFTGYNGPATMVRSVPQNLTGVLNLPIGLQSVDYPLTIRVRLPQIGRYSYFLSDNATSYPLADGSEIILHGDGTSGPGTTTLSLTASSSSALPSTYALSQNYPNPFNPTTQINFEIPQSSRVRLEVFNLLGEKIATLVDRDMNGGYFTVPFDASRFSSGVYYYRLVAQAGSTTVFQQFRKMVFVK